MKKLFIPALVLLGSLSAEARFHEEFARVRVSSTCSFLGTFINPNMTCLRNAVGNSTVTFAEPFTEVPDCFMGNETAGAVISFTPVATSVTVSAVAIASALGVDSTYSLHCIGN